MASISTTLQATLLDVKTGTKPNIAMSHFEEATGLTVPATPHHFGNY